MAFIRLAGYDVLQSIVLSVTPSASTFNVAYYPGSASSYYGIPQSNSVTETTLMPFIVDPLDYDEGYTTVLTLLNGIELEFYQSNKPTAYYQNGTRHLYLNSGGDNRVVVADGNTLMTARPFGIMGVIFDPCSSGNEESPQSYCGLAIVYPARNRPTEITTKDQFKQLIMETCNELRGYTFTSNHYDISGVGGVHIGKQFLTSYYDKESANEVKDPYEAIMEMYGGGPSGPGGGQPSGNPGNEHVPIPETPSVGAMTSGLVGVYVPTAQELSDLSYWLWHTMDVDLFKKMFINPMDALIGLQIIPTVSGHPGSVSGNLVYANYTTSVTMHRATEQYFEVDCGSIKIPERYGAYLDWSPYTRISLYLPYIGTVPIDTDDIMGGTVRVVYKVDIVSGTVVAFVYCTGKNDPTSHVLYTYTGACACTIPLSSGQHANILTGALQTALAITGATVAVATGGASLGVGVLAGTSGAVNGANSMSKLDVRRSGACGGSSGLMGIQKPYLIMTIPRLCAPGDQNVYRGYPSYMTVSLGSLRGFNSIEVNHLSGMTCTDAEADEIKTLLAEGVIF